MREGSDPAGDLDPVVLSEGIFPVAAEPFDLSPPPLSALPDDTRQGIATRLQIMRDYVEEIEVLLGYAKPFNDDGRDPKSG